VGSGGSLTLENLTLQGGYVGGPGAAAEGGGIFSSGTLNLSGVTVKSNAAVGSNGINASKGDGGMGANAYGGGLYVAGGSVTLNNDILSSNSALGGNGGRGGPGGNNHVAAGNGGAGGAAAGGGLCVAGGSFSLSNDTFTGNRVIGGLGGGAGNGTELGTGGNGGADGAGTGGGLYVATAGSLTLSNDTFSSNEAAAGSSGGFGGSAEFGGKGGNGALGAGGGLYVATAGSLTLSNDTLSNNYVAGGSGGRGGKGFSSASVPAGGSGGAGAGGYGGGLYVGNGSLSLANDTIAGNRVLGGFGGPGGNGGKGGAPIYSGETRPGGPGGAGGAGGAAAGGGLYVQQGNISLLNDTLSGDFVQGGGGGSGGNGGNGGSKLALDIYRGGPGGAGGAGGAAAGGGLYVQQGNISLLNDTLSQNSAQGSSGGSGGRGGSGATNLFAQASGGSGGAGGAGGNAQGGGVYVPASNVTYTLANTLIAENTLVTGSGGAGGRGGAGDPTGRNAAKGSGGIATGPDVSGTVTSSDHDLIGVSDGSSGFNIGHGDLMGTIANPLNPLLGPLAYNGGPTQTMALLPGSPAIDHGDNHAPGQPTIDQRYFARRVNGGISDTVDIGAYEFGSQPGMFTIGSELFIIGDQSGYPTNDSATVGVNSSGGVYSVLNGVTDSFNPGQITSIFIALVGGNNTISILGTPSGVTTDDVGGGIGGGSDTVTLGNGTTQNILGAVNIEGTAPLTNTIVLNDASDTQLRTVTVSNMLNGANPADYEGNADIWGQVSGLAPANINFEYEDTASVTIDGSNAGSTYNIQATGVATTVNGGSGNDTFNLGSGNSLGGLQGPLTIRGGGGTNIFNANDSNSATGQSYTLSYNQLTGSDFAPITYAYASLHALNVTGSGNDTLTVLTPVAVAATTFNGGSGTNTLVGPNASSLTTWTISGANSGKVDGVNFSNFQNLVGGTSSDAFDFTTSTASLSGTLNGGGGTNNNNTLSYATLGSSYRVNVTLSSNTAGTATSIGGGFSNINYLVGSIDTANTLQGPNSTNDWIITGNNAGDINTGPIRPFVFTAMPNLVGGTGVDTFRMHSTSSAVLSINGGGAPAGQGDWLKYSELPSTSTVTVNLATGSATNVKGGAAGSVTNIQNVLGSATGTNILTGDAQGNILIGGSGLNTIVGGSGNSLLIGGSGHGSITGGSGQDILIAGVTTYSPLSTAGVDSLMAILAELQSADSFAQKVYDLIHGTDSGDPNGHGSDKNGSNKLTWGGTVRASTGAFTLKGDTSSSSKPDWFFSNSPSTVADFNDDGVQDEHNNNAIGVF
jgi:hypothetical protein